MYNSSIYERFIDVEISITLLAHKVMGWANIINKYFLKLYFSYLPLQ